MSNTTKPKDNTKTPANAPVKENTRHNVNNQMQEQKPVTEGAPPQRREAQDPLHTQWPVLKGKLKAQWSKLTDDDLLQVNGNQEELVRMLESRYRYDHNQAETEVREFLGVKQ